MSYEPLHHKYRPQMFAELVGQQAIAQTLSNALRQQRIAPAYLFTGARGTGKTSSARIFAKSLNCLAVGVPTESPCGVCDVCQSIAKGSALDVIEIDAASNTGVDNIRELIERAQFAPVQCRFKVYVIDEVHMLSTAAFNALLKTLEEPPDRVVFVLATTDPQKVLPTIISRCQRFDFRRIPLEDMVQHLTAIADKEAIDITAEAVQLVGQISQGGLRDAESLLDQLSLLEGEISAERVWDLVGAVPEYDLMDLLQAIAHDDPATVLDKTRQLMDRGREPLIVLQNLASFYRDLLIAKTAPDRSDLVALTPPTWQALCEFAQTCEIVWITAGQRHLRSSEVQVKNTSQPRLWLEVALLGLLPSAIAAPSVGSSQSTNSQTVPAPQPSSTRPTPAPLPAVTRSVPSPAAPPPASPSITPQPQPKPPEPATESAAKVATSTAAPAAAAPVSSPSATTQEPLNQNGEEAIAPSPAASSSSTQVNLEEMWRRIIETLHPLSKGLLRDHGRLVALNEHQAQIEITAPRLLGIAQKRIPDIEKAFAKVFNRQVKIALSVGEPTTAAPQSLEVVESYSGGQAISPGQPMADSPPIVSDSGQASYSQASQSIQASHPIGQPGSPPAIAPEIVEPQAPTAKHLGPPDGGLDLPLQPGMWQNEDDVVRAAKSLAQMFNGKIVDFESDSHADNQVNGAEFALSPDDPEVDEADDVPF